MKNYSLKRAAALLLGVTLAAQSVSVVLPVSAIEEVLAAESAGVDSGVPEGLAYEISDGTVTITGYSGEATELTIPSEIEGYPVTSIGFYAFSGCNSLTNVTIPPSVTSIEDYAFYDCYNLTSVTIPSSVTSIGYSAFDSCSSLMSVTIPSSVTSIGYGAFSGCSSLKEIRLDSENTAYCVIDGVLFSKDQTELICCPGGRSGDYTIPSSVISIGDLAFDWCNSLTSVTIPSSVTSVGYSAFSHCYELTSVTIPSSVTSIGGCAFGWCGSLTSVTIPSSVTSIGDSVFSGCSSLTNVTIPEGVTSIGDSMFSSCSSLTSVTIPSSVTSIGDSVFSGCSSLTGVTIPSSVTSIGEDAFSGCSSLTEINVDSSNTVYSSIDGVLFNKEQTELILCPGGKSGACTVPMGVTSIESSAFSGCSSLTEINVDSGNTVYSSIDGVLFNKEKTELICCPGGRSGEYTIPEGVASIGANAFYGCSSLTSVTIPEGVTSIGNGAFYDCSSLVSIKLPKGLLDIGEFHTFEGCSSLISIELPSGVTYIGNNTFSGCSSLTSIKISESVTYIGYEVFIGCSSLTAIEVSAENEKYASVDGVLFNKEKTELLCFPGGKAGDYQIPAGLTSIGWYAFYECSKLNSVTFMESNTGLIESSFTRCENVTIRCLPDSTAQQYAQMRGMNYELICYYGDVDGNNDVDASDALAVLKAVVKLTSLTEAQEKAADVDGNGKVDASDALMILKKVVKLIDSFTPEQIVQ